MAETDCETMMSGTPTEWKEVQAVTPARKKPSAKYKIPLIIHQSHKSRKLPVRLAENIQKWAQLNPEFEHRYYDDEAVRGYVSKHGTQKFKDAFNKLESLWGASCRAFQADLFRYLLLQREGGVWVDADMVAGTPLLAGLLPHDQFVTTFLPNWNTERMLQEMMISAPAHPFVINTLKNAVDAVLAIKRSVIGKHHIFNVVGPHQLKHSAMELVRLRYRGSAFSGAEYTAHYEADFEFEGKKFQYRIAPKTLGTGSAGILKYDGYADDLKALGGQHWSVPPKLRSKLYHIVEPLLRRLLWAKRAVGR